MSFYQVSTFSIPRVSQGSISTGLCYMSSIVWTSIDWNNYAQRNMHGRGSNSRPSDLDTMMEDPPLPIQL
jgi:hypothetical protein